MAGRIHFILAAAAALAIGWTAPAAAASFPSCKDGKSIPAAPGERLADRPGRLMSATLKLPAGTPRAAAGTTDTGTQSRKQVAPKFIPVEPQDLSFVHCLLRPQQPGGDVLVLLHGSGGNETSLIAFAARAAPGATLLAVRGRIMQEGVQRWYRRVTPIRFDQEDIRKEVSAFASFLDEASKAYGLDFGNAAFLGYSNGANLLAAASLLRPGLIHRAALLRPMMVLDEPPATDLTGSRFLLVAGKHDDTYAPFAPELAKSLSGNGASVTLKTIDAGHLLAREDIRLVSDWLRAGELTVSLE